MNKGSGCKACPVNEWDCDAQYSSSRCSALRANYGTDRTPITNADNIRNMNHDELARLIIDPNFDAHCKNKKECMDDIDGITSEMCFKCAVEWLHQPKEARQCDG